MSITEIYKSSQFHAVLRATNPTNNTVNNFFILPNGTATSQIDIGIISLVRIGNIVYMNIPLFTFVNQSNADKVKLEILWSKPNSDPEEPFLYYSMSEYDSLFIPNINNISAVSKEVYVEYTAGNPSASTLVPNASVPIKNIPTNNFIRYCIQPILANGQRAISGLVPDSRPNQCENFGFSGEQLSILSIIPSGGNQNVIYTKFISYNLTKKADAPFDMALIISTDNIQYLENDEVRYPNTILPFIYTYYV